MESAIVVDKNGVDDLLTWDQIVKVTEQAIFALNNSHEPGKKIDENILFSVQSQRTFTPVPSGEGFLLCMPSFIGGLDLGRGKKDSALACKLLTVFHNNPKRNPPLSSTNGTVLVYDATSGITKAMIDADQLTLWRTAAVTCVATKILRSFKGDMTGQVLAIIGSGNQGRIHALAFYDQFKFSKIRVWNRTLSKAYALVEELKKLGAPAEFCETTMDCVQGADVIITTTFSSIPLIQDDWVKGDALINAIGVVKQGSEISPEIYKRAKVYVESKSSAQRELSHLKIEGSLAEVGPNKEIPLPVNQVAIFQSLGNGVEDAAVGLLLHHLKTCKDTKCSKNSTQQ